MKLRKHLRKDDGYVMVYVLIAFTILALVAGSICAVALNNLKAQKADVARMEARYAAEGELQKFVAKVEALTTDSGGVTNGVGLSETDAKETAEAAFWYEVEKLDGSDPEEPDDPNDVLHVSVPDPTDGSEAKVVTITAKAEKAGYLATIRAEAELTVQPSYDDNTSTATCTMSHWQYTSYDISYEQKEVPQ